MKRETARCSLLVVTLVIATQLFLLVPVAQAMQCGGGGQGNGNKKRTYAMRVDPDPAQPGKRGKRRGMGIVAVWPTPEGIRDAVGLAQSVIETVCAAADNPKRILKNLPEAFSS